MSETLDLGWRSLRDEIRDVRAELAELKSELRSAFGMPVGKVQVCEVREAHDLEYRRC